MPNENEPLKTGLQELEADIYHADRSAVSKGWLDKIDRSPAHLRAYFDGEHRVTPAMELGTIVHSFVLEPDSVASLYARAPEVDRRTKAGKENWAQFVADAGDKQVVTDANWILASTIRDAVYKNKAAAAILGKGQPEQTVVWKDGPTGELCKARADWLRDSFVADVKTTEDARPDAFMRSIANFRYHVQAGHYGQGFERDRFVFIAVEKYPPYGVAVYAADDIMRQRGDHERAINMDAYAACKATDTWPAYPEIIQPIALPRWAL